MPVTPSQFMPHFSKCSQDKNRARCIGLSYALKYNNISRQYNSWNIIVPIICTIALTAQHQSHIGGTCCDGCAYWAIILKQKSLNLEWNITWHCCSDLSCMAVSKLFFSASQMKTKKRSGSLISLIMFLGKTASGLFLHQRSCDSLICCMSFSCDTSRHMSSSHAGRQILD